MTLDQCNYMHIKEWENHFLHKDLLKHDPIYEAWWKESREFWNNMEKRAQKEGRPIHQVLQEELTVFNHPQK